MPCSAFKDPSRNVGKSVSFASPLEEHHFVQSDQGANTSIATIPTMRSATYQRETATTAYPPPDHDTVHLTFVDGTPEGSEIVLKARRNQPLFETLEAYRDLTDRDWEILRFVYNGIKFSATDTPAELYMSKHVCIEVSPHVEIEESDNAMEEMMNEEDEEEGPFTPIKAANFEGKPLQPEEEGMVITDHSRIVSILEHALSNRTARLVATTDAAGSIALCLSSEDTSMSVPIIATTAATPDTLNSSHAKPGIDSPASPPFPIPQRKAAGRNRGCPRGRTAQKAPRSYGEAKIRGNGRGGKGVKDGRVGKNIRPDRGGSKR